MQERLDGRSGTGERQCNGTLGGLQLSPEATPAFLRSLVCHKSPIGRFSRGHVRSDSEKRVPSSRTHANSLQTSRLILRLSASLHCTPARESLGNSSVNAGWTATRFSSIIMQKPPALSLDGMLPSSGAASKSPSKNRIAAATCAVEFCSDGSSAVQVVRQVRGPGKACARELQQ